jgi:hypothetical protein
MDYFLSKIKKTYLGDWIKRHTELQMCYHKLTKDDEMFVYLKNIFHDDIIRLQQIIDRDLSHWLLS